jgi:thioredoxin 1
MLVEFTDDSLAEALGRPGPALVDFKAPWCGACRLFEPAIAAATSMHGADLRAGSLDVDAYPEVARAYGVLGLPAVLLFRDGVLVHHIKSVTSRATLEHLLDTHLGLGQAQSSTTNGEGP